MSVSKDKKPKVLVGNYGMTKAGANLQGGNGNDYIFAGSGDTIDGNGGNHSIELLQNSNSDDGAVILVSESSGVDTISGFTSGYDDNADRLSMSSVEHLRLSFKDDNLKVKNGSRSMLFDNVTYSNSSSGENADSGEVVRFLIDVDGFEERYAVGGENSTIRVADSDDIADFYFGGGKNTALDFEGYNEEMAVSLSRIKNNEIGFAYDENNLSILFDIGMVRGGNDLLVSNPSEDKNSATTFFFQQGDGRDTISSFEFLTADNEDTADKIDTGGSTLSKATSNGENVSIYVGENNDRVVLQNADGKDFQVENSAT